jgi:hypothetical protein
MNRLMKVALLLLAICSLQSMSFGWGCSGHEVVALIAEHQLNPRAAQEVETLLKDSNLYEINKLHRFCFATGLGPMAFFATWADDFRGQHSETAPWHFWDVPLGSTSVPKPTDFCDQGCVVKALHDQIAVLKSSTATPADKSQALAFVIHFLGDLHQPLHIISNNDRGGNCIPVAFFGNLPKVTAAGAATPNLHALWDTDMPEKLGPILHPTHDEDVTNFVDTLLTDFEEEITQLKTATIDIPAWAMESHSQAVKVGYGKLPHHVPAEKPVVVNNCTDDNNIAQRMLALKESVSLKYTNAANPVIEEQLVRGGTRLAMVLNDIWK